MYSYSKGKGHDQSRQVEAIANTCIVPASGENLFPRDIEQILESHPWDPEVAAAAVVGTPDVSCNQVVPAFIQRPAQDIDVEQDSKKSTQIVASKSASSSQNTRAFLFWPGEKDGVPTELPISHSGKTIKAELNTVAGGLVSRNI